MRVCARGGGQSADEVGARADLADGGGGPLGLTARRMIVDLITEQARLPSLEWSRVPAAPPRGGRLRAVDL